MRVLGHYEYYFNTVEIVQWWLGRVVQSARGWLLNRGLEALKPGMAADGSRWLQIAVEDP